MGDRANIVIQERDGGLIYLYSHWGGTDLWETLRGTLAKRWRWDDSSYLARLIFQDMTRGSEDEETGFGISTHLCDNEHPLLVVNCESKSVGVYREEDDLADPAVTPIRSFSFAAYVNLTEDPRQGDQEEDEEDSE